MLRKNTPWIRVKDAPNLDWEATSTASYKNLIELNDEEFVLALKHFHNKHIQFIKYNVIENEWSQIIPYPYLNGSMDATASTSNGSLVYTVASKHLHIIDLDLKLRKLVRLDECIILFGGYCAVNAKATVHMFASHHPGTHLVWNVNNNNIFEQFPSIESLEKANKSKPITVSDKVCAACLETKQHSDFSKSQLRKKARIRRCKVCVKNYMYINKVKKPNEYKNTENKKENIQQCIPDKAKKMNTITFLGVRSGVYVPFKNILILFGIGYDKKDIHQRTSEEIWKYEINTNTFSQILCTINPLPYFQRHVVTSDGNYIILFYKEWEVEYAYQDDCDAIRESNIYVLDMTDNENFALRKSGIQFPVNMRTYDQFHVTKTGGNKEKNKILVAGFARNVNKEIPEAIVCCIVGWFGSEMLHFILSPSKEFYRETTGEPKAHFTIPIDDIVDSCKSL